MNQLFTYLLQVILSSGLLYGYYHFFLRNKEFHQYNRFYLLFATVLSLCIPFLNIPVYFTEAPEQSSVMFKTLLALSGSEWDAAAFTTDATQPVYTFDWHWLIKTFYTTIAVVLLIRFLSSIIKISRLIRKHKVEKLDSIRFMSTEEPGTPFSFSAGFSGIKTLTCIRPRVNKSSGMKYIIFSNAIAGMLCSWK